MNDTRPTSVDPITRQLIRGGFRAARLECELIIERTAMSAFIREKKDYTVSFLDQHGQEIYGDTMGSDILGCVWEHYPVSSMRPGDLYWYNDPYLSEGSITHTPDMVFIAPGLLRWRDSGLLSFIRPFLGPGGFKAGKHRTCQHRNIS